MKKITILSFIVAALFACNSGGSKEESKDGTSTTEKKDDASDLSSNPDYQKGVELVGKSNCPTCHKPYERIPGQGPSFGEVANKYASYPDSIVAHLANKVRKGGSGVWGEVPMVAHPEISEEDAKAMVKYVLLLKK